jgi:hypothetical protein
VVRQARLAALQREEDVGNGRLDWNMRYVEQGLPLTQADFRREHFFNEMADWLYTEEEDQATTQLLAHMPPRIEAAGFASMCRLMRRRLAERGFDFEVPYSRAYAAAAVAAASTPLVDETTTLFPLLYDDNDDDVDA